MSTGRPSGLALSRSGTASPRTPSPPKGIRSGFPQAINGAERPTLFGCWGENIAAVGGAGGGRIRAGCGRAYPEQIAESALECPQGAAIENPSNSTPGADGFFDSGDPLILVRACEVLLRGVFTNRQSRTTRPGLSGSTRGRSWWGGRAAKRSSAQETTNFSHAARVFLCGSVPVRSRPTSRWPCPGRLFPVFGHVP